MDEYIMKFAKCLDQLHGNDSEKIHQLKTIAKEAKENSPDACHKIIDLAIRNVFDTGVSVKLSALYVIDCILKEVKQPYITLCSKNIITAFEHAFIKMLDETGRTKMYKLRNTWKGIFSEVKLYELDVAVKKIDPKWPIQEPPKTSSSKIVPSATAAAIVQKDVLTNATGSKTHSSEKDPNYTKLFLHKDVDMRNLPKSNSASNLIALAKTKNMAGLASTDNQQIRDPRLITEICNTAGSGSYSRPTPFMGREELPQTKGLGGSDDAVNFPSMSNRSYLFHGEASPLEMEIVDRTVQRYNARNKHARPLTATNVTEPGTSMAQAKRIHYYTPPVTATTTATSNGSCKTTTKIDDHSIRQQFGGNGSPSLEKRPRLDTGTFELPIKGEPLQQNQLEHSSAVSASTVSMDVSYHHNQDHHSYHYSSNPHNFSQHHTTTSAAVVQQPSVVGRWTVHIPNSKFPQIGFDPRLLSFSPQSSRNVIVALNGKPHEVFLSHLQPLVCLEGNYHGLRYDGQPIELQVNERRCQIPLNSFCEVHLRGFKKPLLICMGGPGHELIINGFPFRLPIPDQHDHQSYHPQRLLHPTPSSSVVRVAGHEVTLRYLHTNVHRIVLPRIPADILDWAERGLFGRPTRLHLPPMNPLEQTEERQSMGLNIINNTTQLMSHSGRRDNKEFVGRHLLTSNTNVQELMGRLDRAGLLPRTNITNAELSLTHFSLKKYRLPNLQIAASLLAGSQCLQCGMRFSDERTYEKHLDYHFLKNSQLQQNDRSRGFCVVLSIWLGAGTHDVDVDGDDEDSDASDDLGRDEDEIVSFNRIYGLEDVMGGLSGIVSSAVAGTGSLAAGSTAGGYGRRRERARKRIVCPALENDSLNYCDVCKERFEQHWDNDEDSFMLDNAVMHGCRPYHPVCVEDIGKVFVPPRPPPTSDAQSFDDLSATGDYKRTGSCMTIKTEANDSIREEKPFV